MGELKWSDKRRRGEDVVEGRMGEGGGEDVVIVEGRCEGEHSLHPLSSPSITHLTPSSPPPSSHPVLFYHPILPSTLTPSSGGMR